MRTSFSRLTDQVSSFGNHHRKYLHFIETSEPLLRERLEENGLIDQVHLYSTAGTRLNREMHLIRAVGKDDKEKRAFLGCYYALQFLHMNFLAVDVLSLNLTFGRNRSNDYRHFMKRIGVSFRELTAVYMENLLDLFLPRKQQPEFVIMGLGTRADQDDIDLGIVDDGSPARYALNGAVMKLQREMLKYSSRLHFYLSEHMQTPLYTASIAEYEAAFAHQVPHYIIISEMLGAARIVGSHKLLSEFQHKITDRYYFSRHADANPYHEGYTRGILGEVRSLLARRIHRDYIHPKEDGLRIIKGLAYAQKTVCNTRRVNSWKIIDDVMTSQFRVRREFQALQNALSFFEVFRFLYQLYIVQEEEIYIDDPQSQKRLDQVAHIMGYRAIGPKQAHDILLVNYYEHLENTRKAAHSLIREFSKHLKKNSIFPKKLLAHSSEPGKSPKMLEKFFRDSHFFKGTRYWDDVLELLAQNDKILNQFIDEWNSLKPAQQQRYFNAFSVDGSISFYTYIILLVLLGNKKSQAKFRQAFDRINAGFFMILARERSRTWRIARLYNYNPRKINRYIMCLNEKQQQDFFALLEGGETANKEDLFIKNKLQGLSHIYLHSSRFFRFYFLEVINKFPNFIASVDDLEQLGKFANGFRGTMEAAKTFEAQKEQLLHSFFVDFFRIGLATQFGTDLDVIERDFSEFYYSFIYDLFKICAAEIESELKEQVIAHDEFAIMISGSAGREQAFNDDIDLIVIINSTDETSRNKCSKVMQRMNKILVKTRLLPHYRFAEHFNDYVIRLDELEQLLQSKQDSNFIEKAMLLEAQMVVGSSRFARKFNERILVPYIYEKPWRFYEQMLNEMKSRHNSLDTIEDASINLKEAIGALRDIEAILLISKALYRFDGPVTQKIILQLIEKNQELEVPLRRFEAGYRLIKHMRILYRTMVATQNSLNIDYLKEPARILGYVENETHSAAEQLIKEFYDTCRDGANTIDLLLTRIAQEAEHNA